MKGKNRKRDLEIGDIRTDPFLEKRWKRRQWSGFLAVVAEIGAVYLTMAIGLAGGLLRNTLVVDFAKVAVVAALTNLSATALGLFLGRRFSRGGGRK